MEATIFDVLGICERLAESRCAGLSDASIDDLFDTLARHVRSTSSEQAKEIISSPDLQPLLTEIRGLKAERDYQWECRRVEQLLTNRSVSPTQLRVCIVGGYSGSALYAPGFGEALGSQGNGCLVVGSGPLPATALMLDTLGNVRLTCLDREAEACWLSQAIFDIIKPPHPVHHIHLDVMNLADFRSYDTIFVNAQAGVDDKNCILRHLAQHIQHPCLLIVRSGYALGQLFYPATAENCLPGTMGWTIPPSHLGRSALVLFRLNCDVADTL